MTASRDRAPSPFSLHSKDMVETNFRFYKRVTDEPALASYYLDWLFDRLLKSTKGA